VTSFHHQPEAQHPKIFSYPQAGPADYPISWGLGPDGAADSPIKGTDFAVLSDGRIRSITGFLDQVPAGA
jgi:hypothetical protein